MSETILVTGAFGYVGGRVSRFLAEQTDYTLRLVSHRTGRAVPPWLEGRGDVVVADFGHPLPPSLLDGVSAVVHLAAPNENDSQSDPAWALRATGEGTLALLDAAHKAGVKRFVYFSTARIYGEPLVGLIDETLMPRPIHPYGISHRTAEDFVLAYHDKGLMDAVVLRLSNGFGAPDDPGVNRWTLLANDLCRQAAVARVLSLRSSGVQVRNFITLHDVARSVQHFIELDAARLGNGIFNLAGDSTMSIIEMTQLIASRCEAVLGFSPPIERPEPVEGELVARLDYRADKLFSTGFSLTARFDEEIDACLQLCRDAFGSD